MTVKRVLVITYMWPPKGGVGVMRVMKFAKYLPAFGWHPAILTVSEDAPGTPYRGEDANIDMAGIEVVRAPYKTLFPLLPSRMKELIVYPDPQRGWFAPARAKGLDLLRHGKFDAIISTSPPETTHLIARSLKSQTGVPWIADLRDLWSGCHFARRGLFAQGVTGRMEKAVLKDADMITTVSDTWADALASSIGCSREKIRVVTNGFDDADFEGIAARPREKFTLTYTGKLHKDKQDPEVFFAALSRCITEGHIDRERISVDFFVMGFQKADIAAIAARHGLADIVHEHEPVSYRDSLAAQKSSAALLFFQWKGEAGWYSGKLFEYLGSGVPVLAIADDDSAAARLIHDLNAGATASTAAGIKDVLIAWYTKYTEHGSVGIAADRVKISRYTRRSTAGQLAALLDGVVPGRKD